MKVINLWGKYPRETHIKNTNNEKNTDYNEGNYTWSLEIINLVENKINA